MSAVFYLILLSFQLLLLPKNVFLQNPAFTSQPQNPSSAREGAQLILEWSYNLQGQGIGSASISNVTNGINGAPAVAGKSGANSAVVLSGFQHLFSVNISDTQAMLTFLALQRSDTGSKYRLQIQTGSFITLNSDVVNIAVLIPPSITHISANQTVSEGQNVTLNCEASGSPAPNIAWTRRSENSAVSNALTNVRRQDEGGYRCTADNGIGSPATRDTYMIVHYKPVNVTLEANATENKDCSDVLWVSLACVASEANPPVYNYQLFGNGDLTNPSGTWTQQISKKGRHDYSCLAQHLLGNVTSSKTVTVTFNVPVQISANLITGSNTPRRGEDVALCCHASGFPKPTITWSKVLFNTIAEITSSKWLNFTNIKEDKSGMYICQANNTCGKRNSSVITITVLHPPENVTLNATISSDKVCAPKMVQFTCKAGAAEPEVDYHTLYQNGTVIANMNDSGVFTLWLNTSGHFIYKCEAGNSVGTGTSRNNITFAVEVPALVVYINDSIVVRESANATLFCNASGFPPPNLSWVDVKTGVSKDGAILLLTNLTSEENRNDVYKCVASNECGNDSKSTAIDVQHLPKNVKLNLSISGNKVCAGNMVQFTCKAGAANPKVERYTLYRNDTVIANMSSSGVSTLWLNTTGIFIYKCEAQNEVGTGTSSSISVTVEETASVTSEYGSIVVHEGDNVTISCFPSGVPLPKVSWSYSRDAMVEVGSTLLVPNISRDLNGSAIECSASNACGNDSKLTYVVVQYAPENVVLSKDILSDKVCTGNMIQFTCKAGAANPKVQRYTLYQNGTVIANMRSSGVSTLWLNTSSIFIYKCVADNSVGNGTSNRINVIVEGPFSVTIVNPKTVVKEGDNVVLSCNATGNPAPKVVWVDTRNEEVNSGSTLILPKINKAQNGTYSCVASNACGRDNKTTAIVVEYIERKVTGDQYMTVNSGDSAALTCLVDGYPEPNITWYKGNDIVENSPLNGKALVFNPSKKADSGCYTCIASNKAGKVNVTRCLTVEEESSTSPSKGVTLRITLTITNAECNEAGIEERIRVEIKNVLATRGLENVEVTIRCGSVIVDLILQFSQTVSENDVINTLKTAAREDQFGDFKVDPDSIKATSDDDEGSDCEESFFKDTSCSIKLEVAIGISVAAVVLIVIITAAVGYWIHRKKRKRRKDARMLYQNQVARDPGNEEQRLKGDDPYAQVNNGNPGLERTCFMQT